MHNSSKGHVDTAIRVIKYFKGMKHLTIAFKSDAKYTLSSFVSFLLDGHTITALTDSNWGLQDQCYPLQKQTQKLDNFHTRSMSGHIIRMKSPVHWISKRQTYTARTSAKGEIYAMDKCVKQLKCISLILTDLKFHSSIMPSHTPIYKDSRECILWSQAMTPKGLRHKQIWENGIWGLV